MSKNSVKDAAFAKIIKEEKAKCKAAGKDGKCWLCHRRIDCDLPYTDRSSFTLDHVLDPKSRPDLKHSKRGDGTRNKINFNSRKW